MNLTFAILTVAFTASLLLGVTIGKRLRRVTAGTRPKIPPSRSFPRRAAPEFDAAAQLRAVERAAFRPRVLLNRGERRLFLLLEQACRDQGLDWRVMAQVSLGEILSSPDTTAYRAINSKRVDLLLVNADGWPRHAIEFQGSGHHIGPAATRDAIKKEALRRAGIGYHEVVDGDTPAEVRSLLAKLASRERAAA